MLTDDYGMRCGNMIIGRDADVLEIADECLTTETRGGGEDARTSNVG
jgi:hypothetical protein